VTPILDPRDGDIEDDASSPHQRSWLALAGSLFAEISLPKLIAIWVMLLVLPALLIGISPLVVTAWVLAVWSHTASLLTEIWPIFLLPVLALLGWFGGKRLLRAAEDSFWSLNALAVQPVYVIGREGLRHLVESLLPGDLRPTWRARVRALSAAAAGLLVFAVCAGLAALLWPATKLVGSIEILTTAHLLIPELLANSISVIAAYCAVAALVWGVGDALMAQPRDLGTLEPAQPGERVWRVAHLSDLHTVGEQYGFRIESGRDGPRGNERLAMTLARLNAVHAERKLDVVLITGDLTDAGRSAEWAEFFTALSAYPDLAARVVALPGNHDVNVVDRASPARMDTPMSPTKRLRQLRTLSALERLQGTRLRVMDDAALGATLSEALRPHAASIAAFADTGGPRRRSHELAEVWDTIYPMVLPPEAEDGLGIVVMNSNAETHFSFTNALGIVSTRQADRILAATALYPRACWILALHHHVIEYPQKANALSMRIGTALINGSWMIRRLGRLAGKVVLMHGHRHVDWVGTCGGLLIVSAPSPVMGSASGPEPYFYVHSLAVGTDGALQLRQAEKVTLGNTNDLGQPI